MKVPSILKKVGMALTGGALVLFLIAHLLGNLQLFAGAEKFNAYAQALEDNPILLIPAEIGLLAVFVVHIYLAFSLTLENRRARPDANEVRQTSGQSSFASRNMWPTGWIIFVFIVVHVSMFKFGQRPPGTGLWGLVVDRFRDPLVVVFYVAAMLALGVHLSHAVASIFQSLGLRDRGGRPTLWGIGPAMAWGLALGFAILPLWVIAFDPKPKIAVPHTFVKGAPGESGPRPTESASAVIDGAVQPVAAGAARGER